MEKSDNNVVELHTVRTRAFNDDITHRANNDKRMQYRLESDDRLFVQIVLSACAPDLVGTTLACRSVNLSAGGIQFETTQSVPTGTLLDLWIDIKSRPGKFFLAGEVRWSRASGKFNEDGSEIWFTGVQLKTGATTDILDWREYQVKASAR
ncbi:MAG: PilZ domain-containing protein [Pseudomonadales bacterium]|nr:PilZ domain-containing protein [Pseudomonadales bacterium]